MPLVSNKNCAITTPQQAAIGPVTVKQGRGRQAKAFIKAALASLVTLSLIAPDAMAFYWRANGKNTWGYYLMTRPERKDHVRKVRALKTLSECRTLLDEHRKMIEQRAHDKGVEPPSLKGDLCENLKRKGKIKE